MIELLKDTAFTKDRFYLVFIHKLIFLQNFYGVEAACIYFASKDHLAEASSSNHFNLLEVLYCNLTFLSNIKIHARRTIQLY